MNEGLKQGIKEWTRVVTTLKPLANAAPTSMSAEVRRCRLEELAMEHKLAEATDKSDLVNEIKGLGRQNQRRSWH